MQKKIVFLLAIILLGSSAYARFSRVSSVVSSHFNLLAPLPVASPSLRCLAVQPNGSVLLSWILPDTVGTNKAFNCYLISSSSNAGGPFTPVDSIFNYGVSSYLNASANAKAGSIYYCIQTRYQNGNTLTSAPIDTLRTISLVVGNPGNGTAQLKWNALAVPLPPSSEGWYHIYRQYPGGVWMLIDSTKALTFTDTITTCHSDVNYKIEISDLSGCSSISTIAGGTFSDLITPDLVILDSVSVDANGKAQLGWMHDQAKDTKGYVIYKFNGTIWTAIDTIFGAGITNYTVPGSTAGAGSETYGVAAFDSCGNISPLGPIHHSLFLKYNRDICAMNITLNWNSYIHMPKVLGGYTILMTVNGGAQSIAGTTIPGDTSFTVSNLSPLSVYCFIIVANNGTATIQAQSNQICYTATIPKQPLFNYLRVATVLDANSIRLNAYVDIAASVHQYNFYRSVSASGPFTFVASVSAPAPGQISITDHSVNTLASSYYYNMFVVDSCGEERSVTNTDRTILLKVSANDESTTNTLTWNDYETWLGNVQSYNIYRAIDGVWQTAPLTNVPFGTNIYADNVGAFYTSSGKFEYYVQALEGGANTYGFRDTSNSNIAEALQNAEMYIPNAFTPQGKNAIFKPSGSFIDVTDYFFAVFDRWGEKVFQTSDKNGGWDGTISGGRSEMGVYVYLITYKTSHGEYVDRKGTVTLLR
jgi:gliding motility-associated-like protein